ncbi:DUF2637 domain-containing protein [Saccharopolyspora sp. K220]|uniref:DUF2637 domain-containing protein n=1 Tax=Saccharopolyspora soli TaxID=2926618 RepID=UPI001F5824DB|nr:DUF2637 domain-containing protein [Saccharopolyspora soli]MCI2421933.1 DUF2637 domain-containing protein [Saccharopolyspora soli]
MSDQPKNTKPGHGLWLSRAALGFVALAAVMGWGASFVGLHAYGQDQMVGFSYWTAWLIPATFDGAAFGATLITYRASIYGRSALRGRLLMWTFTAISSWINWIHQLTPEARVVAAGLPVAAVAVFDVVLAELRADYEERHGKRRLRLRPGLLLLRWLVDRGGTAGAFRRQVTDIPVSEIAGLGPTFHEQVGSTKPALPSKPPEPPRSGYQRIPIVQQPSQAPPRAPVAAEPRRSPESPGPAELPDRAESVRFQSQQPASKTPEATEAQTRVVAEAEPEGRSELETPAESGTNGRPQAPAETNVERDEPSDQTPGAAEAPAAPEPANASNGTTAKLDRNHEVDPSEQTQTLPPVPEEPLTDENKRTFARRDYRLSLEIGEPITGAQLGQRYGFSERWGRRQIAAVRDEMEHDELTKTPNRELISVD